MITTKQTFFSLWFLLLITTTLIYFPGLYGSFEFDDIANIVVNQTLAVDEFSFQALKDIAFSRSDNSGSGRPISILSFALNVNTTGWNPFYFKVTNLFIHLLNGILVFVFVKILLSHGQLTKNSPKNNTLVLLALGISAFWLIHPIQLTSVLYVVQRMTSLSALFLLLAFIVYIKGRALSQTHPSAMPVTLLSVSLLTVLAVLSKENGALAPLFLLLIESFTYKFKTRKRIDFILLLLFFGLSIGLLLYFILPGQPLSRWSEMIPGRHFSLTERLYSEVTVIWLYLSLILTPVSEHFSIYHDYWPVSKSLLQPISTLVSLLALLGCLLLAVLSRHKYPFLLFGLLWFLAGHAMESTFIPLELVHEHRNYLPSLGILLALFFCLYQIKNFRLFTLLYLLFVSLFAWATYERSVDWSNEMKHAIAEVKNHPASARSNYQLGRVMYYAYKKRPLQASYLSSSQFFKNAIELSDYNLNAYIGHFILDGEAKKPLDRKLFQAFLIRLEFAPMRNQSFAYFQNLYNCQIEQRCPFSHDEFIEIFRAMNRNQQLSTRLRNALKGMFYAYMGWYQQNHDKDIMEKKR